VTVRIVDESAAVSSVKTRGPMPRTPSTPVGLVEVVAIPIDCLMVSSLPRVTMSGFYRES
jgi:hypothetical protein